MEKYRRPGPELTEESFRRFERLVPDRTFTVARDGARVVGFALGMFGHGVLHVLRYARDPALSNAPREALTFGGVGASMRRPNAWPDVEARACTRHGRPTRRAAEGGR